MIPALKQVFGVADVSNFGGETTEFQLALDPAKLAQYNLSLQQVIGAVKANNANAGGSLLVRGDQAAVIRGIGLVRSLDDLGEHRRRLGARNTALPQGPGQAPTRGTHAQGHRRQGRGAGRRQRDRPSPARFQPLARSRGRPREGRDAQRRRAAFRRSGRPLPGPHRAREDDPAHRVAHAARGHGPGDHHVVALPRQPAKRVARRAHHPPRRCSSPSS